MMNLDARKLAFIQRFAQLKDESTLKKFEQLLELEDQHFKPMSEQEYQNHVQEGMEDYKSGKVTTNEDFQKEIKILLDSFLQVEIPDQVGMT